MAGVPHCRGTAAEILDHQELPDLAADAEREDPEPDSEWVSGDARPCHKAPITGLAVRQHFS
jgi:hypothetical protein